MSGDPTYPDIRRRVAEGKPVPAEATAELLKDYDRLRRQRTHVTSCQTCVNWSACRVTPIPETGGKAR